VPLKVRESELELVAATGIDPHVGSDAAQRRRAEKGKGRARDVKEERVVNGVNGVKEMREGSKGQRHRRE
jgi:hypothetical protein